MAAEFDRRNQAERLMIALWLPEAPTASANVLSNNGSRETIPTWILFTSTS